MENKPPLSPHIQIYRWHISSLVSITHRITGIINIIGITFICLLASLVVFGEDNYELINLFLTSSIGSKQTGNILRLPDQIESTPQKNIKATPPRCPFIINRSARGSSIHNPTRAADIKPAEAPKKFHQPKNGM